VAKKISVLTRLNLCRLPDKPLVLLLKLFKQLYAARNISSQKTNDIFPSSNADCQFLEATSTRENYYYYNHHNDRQQRTTELKNIVCSMPQLQTVAGYLQHHGVFHMFIQGKIYR
jgi:hypothetical protein